MSAAEVSTLLSSAEILPVHVRYAVHHLTKPERAVLYDETSPLHRSVVGKYFEALVYELLLSAVENSDAVVSVVSKFSDACFVPYDKYAPDGLWYSRDGGIRFKVDGRVAAEMDLLIKTADGVRVFGEVIVNPSSVRGFRSEIAAKKQLLSELYGDPVEFLMVLASPPAEGGLRCLEGQDSHAVVLNGDSSYAMVHPGEVMKRKLTPSASRKRIDGKNW
ncbi:hypothetical protein [Methanorbis rubei]|uniref:Uncharacterized protein n=1 Tax=Methanorbis rubei TaxID=3028300 RepID=A0AAE4SB83_9EURY|nr:hypothetical protein [Methanocorpusculaceae archaeon Cs1]